MKLRAGFTLIELMIVISLGILLVGGGTVSLNRYKEKQDIETTRQELMTYLRLTRNYAITGQLPSGGNSAVATINLSGVMLIGSRDINNNDVGSTFFNRDIAPAGVGISVGNSAKEVKFSVSDGRLINGGSSLEIGISGKEVKKIKIDPSGLIYEN